MGNISKHIYLLVGFFLIVAILALLALAYRYSDFSQGLNASQTYEVKAPFTNVGGLRVRSPVSIAGVKIGEVKSIELDDYFNAVVSLSIDARFNQIPTDSYLQISTKGLLGEQFVNVDAASAGFEDGYWQDGYEIAQNYAIPALSLEKIVSQFLFSQGDDTDTSHTSESSDFVLE